MGTSYEIAKGIVFLASDDVTFMTSSTLVVDVGITALRAYWQQAQQALDRNPKLRFELERVYASKDAITIAYRNHRGQAAETLIFDERGLVTEGLAAYAS
jgi:hypothetical protein